MQLRDKVLYMGQPAWIVGVRQPNRDQMGRFYDLSRQPDSPYPYYLDVHQGMIEPFRDQQNEVCEIVAEFDRLKLVKA